MIFAWLPVVVTSPNFWLPCEIQQNAKRQRCVGIMAHCGSFLANNNIFDSAKHIATCKRCRTVSQLYSVSCCAMLYIVLSAAVMLPTA